MPGAAFRAYSEMPPEAERNAAKSLGIEPVEVYQLACRHIGVMGRAGRGEAAGAGAGRQVGRCGFMERSPAGSEGGVVLAG